MSLTSTVRCDGYKYQVAINELDEKVIVDAKKRFEDMKSKGVIIAEHFNAHEWTIYDEAHYKHKISFEIDELHFRRVSQNLLGCSLDEFKTALRVMATMLIGSSSLYLQSSVRAIRTIVNTMTKDGNAKIVADKAEAIQSFLSFLPGDNDYRGQLAEMLDDAAEEYADSQKGDARQLCYYQSYLRFDKILKDFWAHASKKDKILYFPLYLWWELTMIIPLRPFELVHIPRDCLQFQDGKPILTVRRTKLKGMPFTAEHVLEKDFEKEEFVIPQKIADEINDYIDATKNVYDSDIDTLFCKFSQFRLTGASKASNKHYTYSNLNQLLKRFYRDIVLRDLGYELRPKGKTPLVGNEIEKISLGDTRHVAMVSLMTSGKSALICQALAGHDILETGQNYYGKHIETFLDALVWERVVEHCPHQFVYDGPCELPALSMAVEHGICYSQRACRGDYSDCTCAVNEYGEIGDCRACIYLDIPMGKEMKSVSDDEDRRIEKAFIRVYDAIRRATKGEGPKEEVDIAINRFQAAAAMYVQRKSITVLKHTQGGQENE